MKSDKLRIITALLVLAVVTVGFVTNYGIGTLSSFGILQISLLCPLGALSTLLASKLLVPRAFVSLALAIILIVLFARAFCGWVCPAYLIQKASRFLSKKPRSAASKDTSSNDSSTLLADNSSEPPFEKSGASATDGVSTAANAPLSEEELKSLKISCGSHVAKRGEKIDSRHIILGGSLLSALVFGFPVFCLICPIGLSFALVLLLINLFANGAVTWSLIAVPVILAVELIVFRRWCHEICPLSAFMSLIGKANRTFVPTIDDSVCRETSMHTQCGACGRACEEGIDLRHPELSEASINECTKCRRCVETCPEHAIRMPFK